MLNEKLSLRHLYDLDGGVKELSKRYDLESEENEPIDSLCASHKIDVDFFVQLTRIFHDANYFPAKQLQSFSTTIILDYLQRTHRYYLDRRLPEIEQMIEHVTDQVDDKTSSFLQRFYFILRRDLSAHIRLEEKLLFPYIKELSTSFRNQTVTAEFDADSQNFSVEKFVSTHDEHVEDYILNARKKLIEDHQNVDDLLPLRVLLYQFELFEKDLRVHGKVEDLVLVPKALEMERTLFPKG